MEQLTFQKNVSIFKINNCKSRYTLDIGSFIESYIIYRRPFVYALRNKICPLNTTARLKKPRNKVQIKGCSLDRSGDDRIPDGPQFTVVKAAFHKNKVKIKCNARMVRE